MISWSRPAGRAAGDHRNRRRWTGEWTSRTGRQRLERLRRLLALAGLVSTLPEGFTSSWLAWYDSNLAQDDYVRGAAIYALAVPTGWGTYEILGLPADILKQYLSVHPRAETMRRIRRLFADKFQSQRFDKE